MTGGPAPAGVRSPDATSARGSRIEVSRLDSGLRVVTERMTDVRSVAIGFWVGTGSRDEGAEIAGASHFLEHLLFKGTGRRSAADIAEAVDEVGGDCNAFTTKEYTTFYIRLLAEHLSLGIDILSDIMTDPALRPADVDSERSVILDEILMHSDEPGEIVAERWMDALFPGHPLGRDALGTAESVADLGTDEIRAFFDVHYRPANMVLSVAGDCRHDEVVAEAERRFGGPPSGRAPRRTPPDEPPRPLVVVERPTEQVHLMMGCRGWSRFDERRWAAALLNQVLGGGLSSRLFRKIREERGLAYSVASERAAYQDTGTVGVAAGTAPEHVEEVLRIAADELGQLAADGVTERELSIAKGNLRADVLLAGEDSGARMSRIGSALLLHDEVLTVDELLAKIEGVDREQVRTVARAIAAEPRTLAVVGPLDEGHAALSGWTPGTVAVEHSAAAPG